MLYTMTAYIKIRVDMIPASSKLKMFDLFKRRALAATSELAAKGVISHPHRANEHITSFLYFKSSGALLIFNPIFHFQEGNFNNLDFMHL